MSQVDLIEYFVPRYLYEISFYFKKQLLLLLQDYTTVINIKPIKPTFLMLTCWIIFKSLKI